MFPLEISFRNFESTEPVKQAVEKYASKLEKHFDNIESGRVVLSAPHRHSQQGKIFHVNIQLKVPGQKLVVSHEPENDHTHEDIYITIRDSFEAMKKELDRYVRKLNKQEELRGHVTPPRGKVIKVFLESGYGFLKSKDGEEVYFHENSVLNQDFYNLSIGDTVLYSLEMGEKGPQASSLSLTQKKKDKNPRKEEEIPFGKTSI